MTLVGANPAPRITGDGQLPGKTNYFVGSEAEWRRNIPNYAKVHYGDVYPGVDLVYYGEQGQLEYDFIVAPQADPSRISLSFEGAEQLNVDANGDLVMRTAAGELRHHKPVIYQDGVEGRHAIAGQYAIRATREVGFELGDYDSAMPLIIDPVLSYGTFIGTGDGVHIAVNSAGNVYLAGTTTLSGLKVTTHTRYSFGGDLYVAKLNVTGSDLEYASYFGYDESERVYDVAVDASDNVYVGCAIGSSLRLHGFVAKFNSVGDMVFAEYLPGEIHSIAVDSAQHVYATGRTDADDFPVKTPLLRNKNGARDAFVTKLNTTATDIWFNGAPGAYATGDGTLVYSTYLGGSGDDSGLGIAVDSVGNAYVTGETTSTDFPPGTYSFQGPSAGHNAFVAALDPRGAALIYSTYIGGTGDERGEDIAVDSARNAYIVGWTNSSDFPVIDGVPLARSGGDNGFVTQLGPNGHGAFSTLLGGSGDDRANSVAVDASGNVFATGFTTSVDFRTTADAVRPSFMGGSCSASGITFSPCRTPFVTKLFHQVATGVTSILYSSYLDSGSGALDDEGMSIALDPIGGVYVSGRTGSPTFPTTPGAFRTFPNGWVDGFVVKMPAPPISIVKPPPMFCRTLFCR